MLVYVNDEKARQEFMQIKHKNKVRLAKYIKEHNGIDVNPDSIFDVQVKRLHEYKRQLLNILHVMYLYNEIKKNPDMDIVPRTFIFGAKAAAGYKIAKQTIKLINNVADVINNDESINGKIKVVFIENYRVSNAEIIFAAADVSEQISTASKEASGTGNMKFMLNGAITLGTMDGANVEIVQEVGEENAVIFGLRSDEVIRYENEGGYDPMEIFNNDQRFLWNLSMVSILRKIQRCSGISTTHFLTHRREEEQILTSFLRTSVLMQKHRLRLIRDTGMRLAGLRQL